jgi:hypothetical protein
VVTVSSRNPVRASESGSRWAAGNPHPAAGLAEGGLQVGGVRHGHAGAVDQEQAMAPPPLGAAVASPSPGDDHLQQVGEDIRESADGLAIRRRGERPVGEVLQVRDGGAAFVGEVEGEVGDDGRGEGPLTTGQADGVGDLAGEGGGYRAAEVALEAGHDPGETTPGDLPSCGCRVTPPSMTGGRRLPQAEYSITT